MPCHKPGPKHNHIWPTSGLLVIERCETLCQYCKGAHQKHNWKHAWFLRRHVASVHCKAGADYQDVVVHEKWSGAPNKDGVLKKSVKQSSKKAAAKSTSKDDVSSDLTPSHSTTLSLSSHHLGAISVGPVAPRNAVNNADGDIHTDEASSPCSNRVKQACYGGDNCSIRDLRGLSNVYQHLATPFHPPRAAAVGHCSASASNSDSFSCQHLPARLNQITSGDHAHSIFEVGQTPPFISSHGCSQFNGISQNSLGATTVAGGMIGHQESFQSAKALWSNTATKLNEVEFEHISNARCLAPQLTDDIMMCTNQSVVEEEVDRSPQTVREDGISIEPASPASPNSRRGASMVCEELNVVAKEAMKMTGIKQSEVLYQVIEWAEAFKRGVKFA